MAYDFSQLDFDGLKQTLIAYIKEDATFADYNFDGSALNSLANLLSYIMLQQNFYLNMTVQELYLDSATLYRNAVAIAKSLNYSPYRNAPAHMYVDIAFPDKIGSTITIPLYCSFKVNDIPFITKNNYNITNTSALNIELFQLEMKTETFIYDNNPIELAYGTEISNDDLIVKVDGVAWDKYDSTSGAGTTSEVYFVNINYNDKLEIAFGNNTFGKSPSTNADIEVVYGITQGVDGNNLNEVSLDQVVYDNLSNPYASADFTNATTSISGADYEPIESIKLNAPRFYEAQNRAVTLRDYETIVEQRPEVKLANVWSGIDNVPSIYGSVYIAAQPSNSDMYLSTLQKSELTDYVKTYSPLSIRVNIVDPFYVYVNITSNVYYYKSYGVSTTSLKTTIENNVADFFDNDLTTFNTKLRYSQLLKTIDIPTEVSNNTTDLSYFVKVDQSPTNYYNIELKNKILQGSIVNDYVYDSNGYILDKIDDSNLGTIDYSTGILKFSKILDLTDNVISFQLQTDDADFVRENLPVFNNIDITFVGI